MNVDRPDLSQVAPEVAAYIEALESEVARLHGAARRPASPIVAPETDESLELAEPETTLNVVSVSRAGDAKRTPRHLYGRQRRGGMGVFDLQTADDDEPALLAIVDAADALLLLTNLGRAYRLPLSELPETAVRGRGNALAARLRWQPGERPVAAVPATSDQPYLALASERGWVRRIRDSYLGPKMIPGTIFHNVQEGGHLVGAAWTAADDDLFVVTRTGQAIRFNGAQVPTRGCLGLRVDPADRVAGLAGVTEDGGVFLLGADGKGTIRLMSGFRLNKAPGAGGKVAMKCEDLAGVTAVDPDAGDDLFAISRLGKIIRFAAAEVPAKEGVVQGVNCMTLRADMVTAVARTRL